MKGLWGLTATTGTWTALRNDFSPLNLFSNLSCSEDYLEEGIQYVACHVVSSRNIEQLLFFEMENFTLKETKHWLKDEITYMKAFCWKYYCIFKLDLLFISKGIPQSIM